MILGDRSFLRFVSEFAVRYPDIAIDLQITNQFVDLIADNIDVAIRFGELKSASVVARKLGSTVRYVVAAPSYLSGRARPRQPADLSAHRCVLLNAQQPLGVVGSGERSAARQGAGDGAAVEPRLPVGELLRVSRARGSG